MILPMLEWLFSWEVSSWIVGSVIAIAFALIPLDDFNPAKGFFLIAAVDASGGVLMWGIKRDSPTWQLALVVFFMWGVIGALTLSALKYVDHKRMAKESSQQAGHKGPAAPPRPSLVFVFGAPLGDNDSAQWIMMLKHYGPGAAYNCDIVFYDDDRKNIEHEWLIKHPSSPYLPAGLAGESQKRIYIPEASLEGSVGSYMWNPLDPNSQHYTVSITCRDGVFVEKWEVARVNGILRSAITIEHGPQWIEKNPGLESVVFRYQDPDFVRTSLATEMPKVSQGRIVHPGWRPLHRFEVPAAIIDPNGNVEVVSGIKLPDGSTQTDFGSWNILTRHFGDDQDSSSQP
jgi:hypothetical protein